MALMNVPSIDSGRTAEDYARHRAGFPPALFEHPARAGILRPGIRLLDVGTGTGTIARGCSRHGVRTIALDPSFDLLAKAVQLDRDAGTKTLYLLGRAEDIPLREGVVDVVVGGQCWHWFDRPRAANRIFDVLPSGGTLVITHFDWLPLAGNIVSATEGLILRHNPAWHLSGGTGICPA